MKTCRQRHSATYQSIAGSQTPPEQRNYDIKTKNVTSVKVTEKLNMKIINIIIILAI